MESQPPSGLLLHLRAPPQVYPPGIQAETLPPMDFSESCFSESLSTSEIFEAGGRDFKEEEEEELHLGAGLPEEKLVHLENPHNQSSPEGSLRDLRPRSGTRRKTPELSRNLCVRKTPDFSRVAPRVVFPKGSPVKKSLSRCSSVSECLSPDFPMNPADFAREVLLNSGDGASDLKVQQAIALVEQLQENYDRLLTKHAEAENTIDRMRVGAKVSLISELPKPSPSVQSTLNLGSSKCLTLDFSRPQRAHIHSADADAAAAAAAAVTSSNGHSEPSAATQTGFSAEQPTQVLQSQAEKFFQQLYTFEDLLKTRSHQPFKQMKGLLQLVEELNSLERSYLRAKDEHTLRQERGGDNNPFDLQRDLEQLIGRFRLHVEGLKEQVEQLLQEAPPPEAPPPDAPPTQAPVWPVSSEGEEAETQRQSPSPPLPLGPLNTDRNVHQSAVDGGFQRSSSPDPSLHPGSGRCSSMSVSQSGQTWTETVKSPSCSPDHLQSPGSVHSSTMSVSQSGQRWTETVRSPSCSPDHLQSPGSIHSSTMSVPPSGQRWTEMMKSPSCSPDGLQSPGSVHSSTMSVPPSSQQVWTDMMKSPSCSPDGLHSPGSVHSSSMAVPQSSGQQVWTEMVKFQSCSLDPPLGRPPIRCSSTSVPPCGQQVWTRMEKSSSSSSPDGAAECPASIRWSVPGSCGQQAWTEMGNSQSCSLSSLAEMAESERRDEEKGPRESRRDHSQDGLISPEMDSGFMGSDCSRLTPAAASSPLQQGAPQRANEQLIGQVRLCMRNLKEMMERTQQDLTPPPSPPPPPRPLPSKPAPREPARTLRLQPQQGALPPPTPGLRSRPPPAPLLVEPGRAESERGGGRGMKGRGISSSSSSNVQRSISSRFKPQSKASSSSSSSCAPPLPPRHLRMKHREVNRSSARQQGALHRAEETVPREEFGEVRRTAHSPTAAAYPLRRKGLLQNAQSASEDEHSDLCSDSAHSLYSSTSSSAPDICQQQQGSEPMTALGSAHAVRHQADDVCSGDDFHEVRRTAQTSPDSCYSLRQMKTTRHKPSVVGKPRLAIQFFKTPTLPPAPPAMFPSRLLTEAGGGSGRCSSSSSSVQGKRTVSRDRFPPSSLSGSSRNTLVSQ